MATCTVTETRTCGEPFDGCFTLLRWVPPTVSSAVNVHEWLLDEKNLLGLLDHSGNPWEYNAPASASPATERHS